MDKVLTQFEDLFRRTFGPSTAFVVLLSLGLLLEVFLFGQGNENPQAMFQSWFTWFNANIKETKASGLYGTLIVLGLIGSAYIISAVNQLIFDTLWGRRSYRLFWQFRDPLAPLRTRVIERVKAHKSLKPLGEVAGEDKIKFTDYRLYELLGGIDHISTRFYVDEVRLLGVVFLAIMTILVKTMVRFCSTGQDFKMIMAFIALTVVYVLGIQADLAQYRYRAIRLYTNFLVMPDDRITRVLAHATNAPKSSEEKPPEKTEEKPKEPAT